MEAFLLDLQNTVAGWMGGSKYAVVGSKLVFVLLTTILYWTLWLFVKRIFIRLRDNIAGWQGTRIKALQIQNQKILSSADVTRILIGITTIARYVSLAIVLVSYIHIVFSFFDWSRELSLTFGAEVLKALGAIGMGLVDYIPSLIVVIIIVLGSRLLIRLLRLVFDGIGTNRISLPGFYPEWANTSFGLVRVLVILLTLVIIFPYLPGSDSPAFQGVSIFFGVLLSLGSTSAIANIIAGIVITYTRAFSLGDMVRIANTEGNVIERSAFVTRIRTPKNVEISVPNATVLNNHIINYSAQSDDNGLTLHTSITIGYDVAWTTVHKLLLAAAAKTPMIEKDPPPFVLQTSLDDNYVAYEINATTRYPDDKSHIYSNLHANILDSFHKAGVEITSPQYRAVRDGNEAAMAIAEPQASTSE